MSHRCEACSYDSHAQNHNTYDEWQQNQGNSEMNPEIYCTHNTRICEQHPQYCHNCEIHSDLDHTRNSHGFKQARSNNLDEQAGPRHSSQMCVEQSKVVPLIAAVGVAVLTAHVIDASKEHIKPHIDKQIKTHITPHIDKLHEEAKKNNCSVM
jgi:ribosomal protein S26